MEKTPKHYIDIIYGKFKDLSDDEKEQYKKDEEFLEQYFEEFQTECIKYQHEKKDFTENEFYQTILDIIKEAFDPEVKIVDDIQALLEFWDTNVLMTRNIDSVSEVLCYGRRKMEEYREVPIDKTPITLEKVYELTEEFLGVIDEEGELLAEFKNLKTEDKIELLPLGSERGSCYSHQEGKIKYVFDGTVNSAKTLIHEFMHHVSFKEAETNMAYYDFTLLREFLNIYYENAFVKFMDEKGLLTNGQAPLFAYRLKNQLEKDPDNALQIYMELTSVYRKNNDRLNKEDILGVAARHFPDVDDTDELWDKVTSVLNTFSNEHILGSEVGAALTTYRFCTALAHATSLDEDNVKKMFKLARFIKDGETDLKAFKFYLEQIGKSEQEFLAGLAQSYDEVNLEHDESQISIEDIGSRTVKPGQLKGKNIFSKIVSAWESKKLEKQEMIDND